MRKPVYFPEIYTITKREIIKMPMSNPSSTFCDNPQLLCPMDIFTLLCGKYAEYNESKHQNIVLAIINSIVKFPNAIIAVNGTKEIRNSMYSTSFEMLLLFLFHLYAASIKQSKIKYENKTDIEFLLSVNPEYPKYGTIIS